MKTSTITKAVLAAAVVGCVIVAPGAVLGLAPIVKFIGEAQHAPIPVKIPEEADPENVRRSIYRLRKNQYIKIKQVGKHKYKLELTKKGKKLLGMYNFNDFHIAHKGPWDGNWRIFVFDVPERNRWARDTLRKKLKGLGFFQFQKSVWIYPHDCEEEMGYICEFLGTQPYTLVFTGKIRDDYLLRKHFLLKGIFTKSDLKRISEV